MDFIATAKREDEDAAITHVQARKVGEGQIVSVTTKTKDKVIHDIDEEGLTYFTAFEQNDHWETQAEIHVVNGESGDYLRSDQNDTERDHLEELPHF